MPHLHMIQRLDNDFGIQLPVKFLEQIGVQENDHVEICCLEDMIVIHKNPAQQTSNKLPTDREHDNT